MSPASIAAYPQKHVNDIYNLLFCDRPELFRTENLSAQSDLAVVLSPSSPPEKVREIADNANAESRVRALGFNWLHAHKQSVPAKLLLGVIVEMPLDQGLDTLAAYADGRVRYINQTGAMSMFEAPIAGMQEKTSALLNAAQIVVNQIGPWDKDWQAPPPQGSVRLTFLVSDGLYFGQGDVDVISNDKFGGPVLKAATDLLLLVTDAPRK